MDSEPSAAKHSLATFRFFEAPKIYRGKGKKEGGGDRYWGGVVFTRSRLLSCSIGGELAKLKTRR